MCHLRNNIKLTLLLLFAVVFNNFSQITTVINFETEGDGYTPSATEGSGWTDVFNRTNHNMTIVTNEDGYYWAIEDLLALTNPSIDLNQINVSGATSFTFQIDLLAHHYDDWDASDELLITYSLDGGSYQNLMWIQSMPGSASNTPAGIDLGFDGDGDCGATTTLPSRSSGTESSSGCTVSSSNFETFSASAINLLNNSTLDIKFQFNGFQAGDEGIYIDNIKITSIGSSITTPSAPTISSIEDGEEQVTLNFSAGNDGGSTITDYEYSINNGSFFTSMGTTNSPYIITGLLNGTDYNIQIRAVNSEGAGAVSNTAVGSPTANELTLTAFNSAATENFNTLASSGTANSLPSGIFLSEQDNNANSNYSTGTGSSGTGDTYSFGSNGDNDRALGGLASGSLQTSFGAKIRNETGTTLNSVVISYTGESWRIGSADRVDQLDFQYSTDATGLDNGTWTDFDNLDYVNTGQATGSGSIQHTSSLNDTLTNLGVSNTGTFWIRWNDLNATGADDGMAVDDLSITPICKAGTIVASAKNILRGNDITWTYTGSDFSYYEYHWGDNNWSGSWLTNTTDSWGACCATQAQGILYVRATATCGGETDNSNIVSTFWADCYAEDITANVDGIPIESGGDFTINSTVEWTWNIAGNGAGAGHSLGYYWESEAPSNAQYNYVWTTNPQAWSDNAGGQFTSTDRPLYVKSRATGINSCTNYSQPFFITLKKPVISITETLNDFTGCDGTTMTSQSFLVSGSHISNVSGITINAPSGFEISDDDTSFGNSVNLTAISGSVSSTPVYVRLISGSSGTQTGVIICSSTSATDQTINVTGSFTAPPSISTLTDLTSALNTCGKTELTIVTDVSGGNGSWSYSGGTVFFNNSGVTDATINVTPQPSDVNTDITMTWTVGAGQVCDGAIATKTIRFNQPTSISSPDAFCYLWGGLTSSDITTGSNWYKWDALKSMWAVQSSAPNTSTDKLHVLTTDNNCIHASNAVTLETTTLASLNVGSGATMSLGSGTVTLNGDLTNAGTINEGTGTLSLTGAGDQTLSGGGTTDLYNLTLNKTSDNLVLSSPLQVKGTLTMNKGNINNGSNILTIGESSASPGAITHNSGSVTGKLRRYFSDASSSSQFFPIGIASKTRDVTVSFVETPGSNQFLTASYNAGYPQLNGADLYAGLPLTTSDGQLIQNYDDEGYWEINPGSTATGVDDDYSADINSEDYNLTIHMNGLTGVSSTSMDRSKVRIIKSAGPSHTSWVALTHGSTSGSIDSDYTVSALGNGFSFFGAGTDDDNALPVELVSFNGVCNESVVDLIWQTASEQNSEDFEVAYSRDGVDWKTIHSEPAAGYSNTLITYNYTHEGAVSGNNYYRLTQTDINGESVVYDNLILNTNCQTTSEGYFSVFPNPSSGSFSIVSNIIDSENAAQIKILDTKGNLIFIRSLTVFKGVNIHSVQLNLKPGIYYLEFESENGFDRLEKILIY